ncbi:MAG: tRNA 2-thiouridine(34) synthase MnmA [bacterium]
MTNKKKQQLVIVGMSGGVDSSVTAALLKKHYRVAGVFMKNWSKNIQGCCNTDQDLADARRVANMLNIPFYVWNFENQYYNKVIKYFFNEYKAGRTPNPDIMCNKEIKFKLFLNKALRIGADYVATGHYARNILTNSYHLLKGIDPSKDQSYFLCTLGQKELKHALFPIGEYKKTEIRKLAHKFKLPVAEKKDSQGICFIGKINVREFLQENIKSKPGKIVDIKGNVLGQHPGSVYFTIGQREGLDIKTGKGPFYVVGKDMEKNKVIVSTDVNDPLLWRREFIITNISWVNKIKFLKQANVCIRYHHPDYAAKLEKVDKGIKVIFNKPQRAITTGQSAVIYKNDELLGSGIIDKVF